MYFFFTREGENTRRCRLQQKYLFIPIYPHCCLGEINKPRSHLWCCFPLGVVHKCRLNAVKIKSEQSNDKTLPFQNPPLEHYQKASNLMDKQGIVWSRTKPGALKLTIINIDTGIFQINCMPPLSSPSIQPACRSMLASLHPTSLFELINLSEALCKAHAWMHTLSPRRVFKHSGMEVDITNLSNTAEIVTCAWQAINPCKHEESFVRPDVNGHFNAFHLRITTITIWLCTDLHWGTQTTFQWSLLRRTVLFFLVWRTFPPFVNCIVNVLHGTMDAN